MFSDVRTRLIRGDRGRTEHGPNRQACPIGTAEPARGAARGDEPDHLIGSVLAGVGMVGDVSGGTGMRRRGVRRRTSLLFTGVATSRSLRRGIEKDLERCIPAGPRGGRRPTLMPVRPRLDNVRSDRPGGNQPGWILRYFAQTLIEQLFAACGRVQSGPLTRYPPSSATAASRWRPAAASRGRRARAAPSTICWTPRMRA
jgi:hypothetical protein